MRHYACFCDLCADDGELCLAVARYWNDEGEEWHACKKHLTIVKELGLDYEEEFSTPGDIE